MSKKENHSAKKQKTTHESPQLSKQLLFHPPHPHWESLRLLLVAYHKDPNSPFYRDVFPKDLLKIIFKFSIERNQVNINNLINF